MKRSNRILLFLWKLLYQPIVRKASRQIMEGRYLDPGQPGRGRWLTRDVKEYRKKVWEGVEEILPFADIDSLPTHGNRHNVFLAAITTSAYRVLIDMQLPKDYAIQLVADMGWKIYSRLTLFVSLPFHLFISNPGNRMNRILKTLMIFPFSAPGYPGYEVKVWRNEDKTYTHWTHCPPQSFVRQLVSKTGDRGELDAFYKSWCLYDWAAADIMANDGKHNHYTRSKTLSKGDDVCDMCWHGCEVPFQADDNLNPYHDKI